mgnify:CR=1 FL=1
MDTVVWDKGLVWADDTVIQIDISKTISIAGSGWLYFPATVRRQPTEDEKKVHRAISVGNGDPKRFGHGQFIGDDE